jgi:hypothetical protein
VQLCAFDIPVDGHDEADDDLRKLPLICFGPRAGRD